MISAIGNDGPLYGYVMTLFDAPLLIGLPYSWYLNPKIKILRIMIDK